jgi:hypothetical protein
MKRAMRCLYCGNELALLKKLTGDREFCSEAHRQKYQEQYNRLALSRLLQTDIDEVDRSTLTPIGLGVRSHPALRAPSERLQLEEAREVPPPFEDFRTAPELGGFCSDQFRPALYGKVLSTLESPVLSVAAILPVLRIQPLPGLPVPAAGNLSEDPEPAPAPLVSNSISNGEERRTVLEPVRTQAPAMRPEPAGMILRGGTAVGVLEEQVSDTNVTACAVQPEAQMTAPQALTLIETPSTASTEADLPPPPEATPDTAAPTDSDVVVNLAALLAALEGAPPPPVPDPEPAPQVVTVINDSPELRRLLGLPEEEAPLDPEPPADPGIAAVEEPPATVTEPEGATAATTLDIVTGEPATEDTPATVDPKPAQPEPEEPEAPGPCGEFAVVPLVAVDEVFPPLSDSGLAEPVLEVNTPSVNAAPLPDNPLFEPEPAPAELLAENVAEPADGCENAPDPSVTESPEQQSKAVIEGQNPVSAVEPPAAGSTALEVPAAPLPAAQIALRLRSIAALAQHTHDQLEQTHPEVETAPAAETDEDSTAVLPPDPLLSADPPKNDLDSLRHELERLGVSPGPVPKRPAWRTVLIVALVIVTAVAGYMLGDRLLLELLNRLS